MGLPKQRFGKKDALKSFIEPALVYGSASFILFYSMMPYLSYAKNGVLIVVGIFATWRYGWLLLNFTRAFVYAKIAYPRILKKIKQLHETDKYPSHIYFSIPSYKEENWVSVETFKSIMNELSRIPSSATMIVSTSGDPQEDAVIYQTCKAHYAFEKVELVFQHQKEGKRIAMGHSMRAIARRYYKRKRDYNSVTFFMDGDSYLEKGFFEKLLPHFAVDNELGALTTNESAYIHTNSNWYKDWFNLKFGQRHLLFQSHSLSKKVLTLTGRLSAYRTDLIVKEEFISRVENDIITSVMHGKFRFLMGDDKTTWFNLLKDGWNMRYLPDVLCYSLESRDANFLDLSKSLPYRWYGNTLRNSNRALALGPKRIRSFFIWWAILDQRISMWTSLVGITGAIILGVTKAYFYFLFYISWVLFVRVFQMGVIAYNGHLVSVRTVPLMLYTQWIGSLVKIKALFHLSDQKWSKGTEVQSNDDSIAPINHPLFQYMPDYLMSFSYILFFYVMLLTHDAIAFPDFDIFKEKPLEKNQANILQAQNFGIIANDNKDDAIAINKLIQTVEDGTVIQLPKGVIDLYSPLLIQRSNITITGVSKTATKIVSHLKKPNIAALHILGKRLKKVAKITNNINYGESIISAKVKKKEQSQWIQIRQANDQLFFHKIHSLRWKKRYPMLRQEILPVSHYQDGLIFCKHIITTDFEANKGEVFTLEPVSNITLSNFSIEQIVPQHSIEEVQGKYKNLFPEYAVDLIRLEYVTDTHLLQLNIKNAGRHPLVFENVHSCSAKHLNINGAWNKGKRGNGYVRFARAYYVEFSYSSIKDIRHITLQWSSANNSLKFLQSAVDINLHGGYAHDNTIDNIHFFLPAYHKWKAITLTPPDASWAPPDGPRNFVSNIFY